MLFKKKKYSEINIEDRVETETHLPSTAPTSEELHKDDKSECEDTTSCGNVTPVSINTDAADANEVSADETPVPLDNSEVNAPPEDCNCTDASAEREISEDEVILEEDEPLNDFEASIRNFNAQDISPAVDIKKSGFDYVRIFVLIVCIGVCAVSTMYLIRNIHDKIKSEQIYGDIIDSVADGFNADGGVLTNGGKISLLASDTKASYTPTMDEIIKNGVGEVTTPSDYSAELAKMRASLESLRNINADIYAWIKIPDTNINYPVAQTDNNEYYLDHAYTGDNLVNGSIYADFRCDDVITRNYNTVFYGHNITSGSMFHDVEKFFDESVFNNTQIYVYTFDGIYIFKPFSIHEVEYDSGYIDMGFPTGEDFASFATNLAELSEIKYDYTFTGNDRILTLSTCTNGIRTKRYALHAVLVETITD